MGLQIEDGKGKGFLAHVDEHQMLAVNATMLPRAAQNSIIHGRCFSWSHSYDYDAADTILLVASTSTVRHLRIDKIVIASDTATEYVIHSPEYPTVAGTLITGVNDNRLSGNIAESLAYGDETGNTQANVIHRGIIGANLPLVLDIQGRIHLGFEQCVAIDFVTAGTLATATIIGYFEKHEAST